VYLDTSATVKSLGINQPSFGAGSFLELGFYSAAAQTLNITGSLAVGSSSNMTLYFGSICNAGASSQSSGVIELFSGATFSVTGNFTSNNLLTSGGGGSEVNISGLFVNSGIYAAYGDLDQINVGSFYNPGLFLAGNGAPNGTVLTIDIGSSGHFVNSGTMRVASPFSPGATLNINADVDNSSPTASISTGGMYSVNGNTLNVNGTLTNGGTFALYNIGDVANVFSLVNTGSVFVAQGAALNLSNPLTQMRIDNDGAVQINGTLALGTGNAGGSGYYQFANGTLGEHIDASQFGVIIVGPSELVSLNGTLDIQLATGFSPAVGSQYDIISFTPGDLSGTFSSVLNSVFNSGTEKWMVIYNNSGGLVELWAEPIVVPTPEPASLLLVTGGIWGTIRLSTRRK
jgi:hypothetical protein